MGGRGGRSVDQARDIVAVKLAEHGQLIGMLPMIERTVESSRRLVVKGKVEAEPHPSLDEPSLIGGVAQYRIACGKQIVKCPFHKAQHALIPLGQIVRRHQDAEFGDDEGFVPLTVLVQPYTEVDDQLLENADVAVVDDLIEPSFLVVQPVGDPASSASPFLLQYLHVDIPHVDGHGLAKSLLIVGKALIEPL